MQFESYQAECSIPWLNEILVFLTVTLQLCQQLKDKVIYSSFNLLLFYLSINLNFIILLRFTELCLYFVLNSCKNLFILNFLLSSCKKKIIHMFYFYCRFQCFRSIKILRCLILRDQRQLQCTSNVSIFELKFTNF